MSLFREEDVLQPIAEGSIATNTQRNFKQIRLVPVSDKYKKVNLQNDWFNHVEYLNSKERQLRMIRPPQISREGTVSH